MESIHKITLMNVLGTIFRGKNFTYAGEVPDVLQQDYENGRPDKEILVQRI